MSNSKKPFYSRTNFILKKRPQSDQKTTFGAWIFDYLRKIAIFDQKFWKKSIKVYCGKN